MRLLPLVLAAVVICPWDASAQTGVALGGSSSVRGADDFATQAFQDPWDMGQKTDLGPLLGSADQPASGFTSISFASGLFSGTTTASDANVWLLDTGNPNAAPVGRIGTNYPIDASAYKILAVRMSVQTPAQMFVYAWQNTIYSSSPALIASPTTSAGFRTYLIDLSASPSWSGTRRALRLDPAEGKTNEAVQLDWARLVTVDASLCRAISWAGGPVDIYLDTDTTPGANLGPIALTANQGQASPGCPAVAGAYNFYAGALPGGTYKVFVVSSGTPVTTTSAKYALSSWVVNTAPTLTFTAPSEEGSDDDFATTQLGNAWDMNSVADVDFLAGVTSPQITSLDLEAPDGTPLPAQRVYYGTSVPGTAPCPATSGVVGDPIVELLENNKRGKTRQIDADRYRILTVEFGLPGKARDVACGSVARVVWRQKGDLGPGSVSDDIIFNSRGGANVLDKFTLDLKTLLVEQGTGAGGTNWVNGSGGGMEIFRFDPHEFTPATPFFIKRVKLAALEQAKTSYTIRWTYSGAPGTVDLYYTTVANDFNSGTLLASVSAAAGQYTWTIPGQLPTSPATPYYIYARFSDGINANQVYARQPLLLDSTYVPRPRMVLNRSTLNFGITGGGWGYLLLTNFLPSGGNGTFVLRAYASDREGHEAFIGARTIVAQNSSATRPFGAIDTPGQGETISGTSYNNFGWVLARGPSMATPVFGGTVTVVIDGVAAGAPGGWTNRGDLDGLFPAATYPGITKALGVYPFDTTAYAEGIHTIAWAVTTDDGQSDGIGSRYFNVANSTASSSSWTSALAGAKGSGVDVGRHVEEVGTIDRTSELVAADGYRRGRSAVPPGATGRRLVLGQQMNRVVVDASAARASSYDAYASVNGQLRPLPVGASFDTARGVLYWQPGVGYAGDYDFEIVTSGRTRIPVRVVLQPQRSGLRGARNGWSFGFPSATM